MKTSTKSLAGVFLIGFGFFAISVAWASYNAYVPLLLGSLGLTSTAIGAIMALDNVFALFVQPLVGMVSDHTRTPLGRRLPYALIAAPIAAVALFLIPFAAHVSVGLMVFVIGVYCFVMAGWRAPIVALMPDLVPSTERSRANGVINFMGSLGQVLIFATGGALLAAFSYQGPLGLGGILVVIAVALLAMFVKEPAQFRAPGLTVLHLDEAAVEAALDSAAEEAGVLDPEAADATHIRTNEPASNAKLGFWAAARRVIAPPLNLDRAAKRSLFAMLAAILIYTMAANALDTFMTLYLNRELGVPETRVTAVLLPYLAAMIVGAIPAGFIGQRFGRKVPMLVGLAGATVVMFVLFFVPNLTVLMIMMPIFGFLWITIIVNALPLVVEMGGTRHTGTLTAYYYIGASLGAVVSPVLFGVIRDLTGNFTLLFMYSAIIFAIAALVLAQVKHGESAK